MAKHTLHGLDHLRAFAIFFVLLFHYRIFGHPGWVDTAGKFGWTGVDLFFVLSGFLISSQLFVQIRQGEQISFKVFFIKRFFRIIPSYLAVLAIYFIIPAFREREALPPLWRFLSFTQNYGLNIHTSGTFSHVWSLCIEEQFYLLLPILLIALVYWQGLRFGKYLLLFLFIAGFFLRYSLYEHFVKPFIGEDDFYIYWYRAIYYPLYTRLDGLLVGVSIAAFLQYMPEAVKKIQSFGNGFLIVGLLVWGLAYWLCLDEHSIAATVVGFPLVALAYGLVLLSAVLPSGILSRVRSRYTAWLAGLSYVLYLSHKGTIHLTQELFAYWGINPAGNGMIFLSAAGCVLGAILLQQLVERPFLRLRKKILLRIEK